MDSIDFLKMYFGTIFLSTYVLPSVEDIKNWLGKDIHPYDAYPPFDSIECVLRYLLVRVLDKSDYLLNGSQMKCNLKFRSTLKTFDEFIRPCNRDTSIRTFFKKFYKPNFTPQSDAEIDQILEWMLYVIQFDEADLTRVAEGLKLLNQIQWHLRDMKKNHDEAKKHAQTLAEWAESQKRDVDAKWCACYEFEVSGNCSHLEDC